jgi:hypothetical protein
MQVITFLNFSLALLVTFSPFPESINLPAALQELSTSFAQVQHVIYHVFAKSPVELSLACPENSPECQNALFLEPYANTTVEEVPWNEEDVLVVLSLRFNPIVQPKVVPTISSQNQNDFSYKVEQPKDLSTSLELHRSSHTIQPSVQLSREGAGIEEQSEDVSLRSYTVEQPKDLSTSLELDRSSQTVQLIVQSPRDGDIEQYDTKIIESASSVKANNHSNHDSNGEIRASINNIFVERTIASINNVIVERSIKRSKDKIISAKRKQRLENLNYNL